MYDGAAYAGFHLMPHSERATTHFFRAAGQVVGARYAWGAGSLVSARKLLTASQSAAPRQPYLEQFDCSGLVLYLMTATSYFALSQWDATAQPVNGRRRAEDQDHVFWDVSKLAAGDYNSDGLRALCDFTDQVVPGCLVFYAGHVEMYLGRGLVIGANGGGRETRGDDQLACVQVVPFGHRAHIYKVGRPRPEFLL